MTRHPVAQHFPRAGQRPGRRLLLFLVLLPFVLSAVVAPAAAPTRVVGDELSDAQAQQKALARKIAEQKQLIASLNASQARLQGQIAGTRARLNGITDDLAATRRQVSAMAADLDQVEATYQRLVDQLSGLDAELRRVESIEAQKRVELGMRKAQLADRIRQAYEAERTSMLETLLSGASFTDMLAAMSAELDAADQDRLLAQQIAADRATLQALHQTIVQTRADTDLIRQQTDVQKHQLDLKLAELRKTQAKLARLEKSVQAYLAEQRAQYARMAADEAKLRTAMATAAAAKRKLQKKIDQLVAAQFSHGNIPSQYNGTLAWPMPGTITQDFGCTGFGWEPAYGSCAHFHNGIDIVAPYGTAVRAAGAGRVLYVGWNYADGADPAWIVIIAHSAELVTWYGHLQARFPVRTGDVVSKGQVIGYEGNTGHSTGAHLHWMVEFNGTFVNPRLFT